jgi:hypothetical protein
MRFVLACLTVIVVSVWRPSGVHAGFHSLGPGSGSCGTWTADRYGSYPSLAQADLACVLGCLSGIGFSVANADPPRGLDAAALAAWVDNYCQNHPLDVIEKAAAQFYWAHPH